MKWKKENKTFEAWGVWSFWRSSEWDFELISQRTEGKLNGERELEWDVDFLRIFRVTDKHVYKIHTFLELLDIFLIIFYSTSVDFVEKLNLSKNADHIMRFYLQKRVNSLLFISDVRDF